MSAGRTMARVRWIVRLSIVAALACVATNASAVAYRCEVGGKTVYTDLPCATGRQSVIADVPSPRKVDQAAAATRLRGDKAAAEALQRERLDRERRQERVSLRTESERSRQLTACTKLAVRAKRAHEDYDSASLRERKRKQVLARRADEDHAAFCRKR